MHGLMLFKLYNDIKVAYPTIDDWEAESIGAELAHIDNADDIIPAISLCETSRQPWEDLLVFQKVCLVLNGRDVFFDVKQDISIKEILFAVRTLKIRYPEEMFNDEVAQYIATEAIDEGFVFLPKELSFAQRYIPNYFIDSVQEIVQQAYINEAENYVDLMSSEISNVSDTEVGV